MTDYLYATGRLRALERSLIGSDQFAALLEAKSFSELSERLREYGLEAPNGDWEAVLSARLKGAYEEIKSLCPDDASLRLWLYPYDCNNVKAAMKGFLRGIDPRSMTVDFGTVSEDGVIEMVGKQDYSALPPEMRQAAPRAMEAYSKTKDPQVIDLTMDVACYADMLCEAKRGGVKFVLDLVQTKIDLINLLTCIRILRMKSGEIGKLLFRDAWINGGTLSLETLQNYFEGGEAFLWEQLRNTDYEQLALSVRGTEATLTAVEREADNLFMEKLLAVRYVSFGPEIPTAYLLAYEYEVRNLRIIISGKRVGLDTQVIRERIRKNYV